LADEYPVPSIWQASVLIRRLRKLPLKRILLAAISVGLIVATFVYFLPTIANYHDVWRVVQQLSWPWIGALLAATAINIVTFAPPWQVVLQGLTFMQAMVVTQASTALSSVIPGGIAAGVAGSYGMLRSWRFTAGDVTRAVTLTGLWNQFFNLVFPIVAVFMLTITGEHSAALATAAFIGVAVLGIIVAGFVLVLLSDRLASDIGDVAARFSNWGLAKFRRGPVTWNGASFERFRDEAGALLERRWPLLTITTLANTLTVYVVLLVSLRALDVPASQVSATEAFAAWALVRLIGSVPFTPGGIGIVELGLTGALVGFGGNNAGVVAAVLVYRFLTIVPTIVLGALAALVWRRQRGTWGEASLPPEAPGPAAPAP